MFEINMCEQLQKCISSVVKVLYWTTKPASSVNLYTLKFVWLCKLCMYFIKCCYGRHGKSACNTWCSHELLLQALLRNRTTEGEITCGRKPVWLRLTEGSKTWKQTVIVGRVHELPHMVGVHMHACAYGDDSVSLSERKCTKRSVWKVCKE